MLGNCYLEKNYKTKLNAAFLVKAWSYHFGLSMMALGTKLLHAPGVKLNLGRKPWHYPQVTRRKIRDQRKYYHGRQNEERCHWKIAAKPVQWRLSRVKMFFFFVGANGNRGAGIVSFLARTDKTNETCDHYSHLVAKVYPSYLSSSRCVKAI